MCADPRSPSSTSSPGPTNRRPHREGIHTEYIPLLNPKEGPHSSDLLGRMSTIIDRRDSSKTAFPAARCTDLGREVKVWGGRERHIGHRHVNGWWRGMEHKTPRDTKRGSTSTDLGHGNKRIRFRSSEESALEGRGPALEIERHKGATLLDRHKIWRGQNTHLCDQFKCSS